MLVVLQHNEKYDYQQYVSRCVCQLTQMLKDYILTTYMSN